MDKSYEVFLFLKLEFELSKNKIPAVFKFRHLFYQKNVFFVNIKLIILPCFYTFISVDYIEFLSPVTPMLPSLGMD